MHTYIHICMYVCMYVRMNVIVYMYYVCMYVRCMYVYLNNCLHRSIYVHTVHNKLIHIKIFQLAIICWTKPSNSQNNEIFI